LNRSGFKLDAPCEKLVEGIVGVCRLYAPNQPKPILPHRQHEREDRLEAVLSNDTISALKHGGVK
jgi:hypothetical protein